VKSIDGPFADGEFERVTTSVELAASIVRAALSRERTKRMTGRAVRRRYKWGGGRKIERERERERERETRSNLYDKQSSYIRVT
jgi:hypothetical protein